MAECQYKDPQEGSGRKLLVGGMIANGDFDILSTPSNIVDCVAKHMTDTVRMVVTDCRTRYSAIAEIVVGN